MVKTMANCLPFEIKVDAQLKAITRQLGQAADVVVAKDKSCIPNH